MVAACCSAVAVLNQKEAPLRGLVCWQHPVIVPTGWAAQHAAVCTYAHWHLQGGQYLVGGTSMKYLTSSRGSVVVGVVTLCLWPSRQHGVVSPAGVPVARFLVFFLGCKVLWTFHTRQRVACLLAWAHRESKGPVYLLPYDWYARSFFHSFVTRVVFQGCMGTCLRTHIRTHACMHAHLWPALAHTFVRAVTCVCVALCHAVPCWAPGGCFEGGLGW